MTTLNTPLHRQTAVPNTSPLIPATQEHSRTLTQILPNPKRPFGEANVTWRPIDALLKDGTLRRQYYPKGIARGKNGKIDVLVVDIFKTDPKLLNEHGDHMVDIIKREIGKNNLPKTNFHLVNASDKAKQPPGLTSPDEDIRHFELLNKTMSDVKDGKKEVEVINISWGLTLEQTSDGKPIFDVMKKDLGIPDLNPQTVTKYRNQIIDWMLTTDHLHSSEKSAMIIFAWLADWAQQNEVPVVVAAAAPLRSFKYPPLELSGLFPEFIVVIPGNDARNYVNPGNVNVIVPNTNGSSNATAITTGRLIHHEITTGQRPRPHK
jgi:hypothetical protein